MPTVKLEKDASYRVLYAAVRNPFAGVAGVNPIMPVRLMRGINETAESVKLSKGQIITYTGTKTGWGADPGLESWFRTEDGFEGEFFPAEMWGGVSDVLLEKV
jgi:hypothetical protein